MIYAQVQSIAPNNNSGCGNTNGCQLGVLVTTNGGTTWSFMAGSAGGALRNCAGGNTSSNPGDYPQNWYDQGIAVDPNNADRIFVDTYDIWLATRTGTAFTDMTLRLQRLLAVGPRGAHRPARARVRAGLVQHHAGPAATAASTRTLNANAAVASRPCARPG